MAVMFYHLTHSPVERTAHSLLSRALEAGWRVMVRGDEPTLSLLDDALWTMNGSDFLPHGREGGADARQPVLLGTGPIGNGANCLMVVGRAAFDPAEAAPLDRLWVLFDGMDNDALARARDQWRAVVQSGVTAQYWSEETGRWQMKAERSGSA